MGPHLAKATTLFFLLSLVACNGVISGPDPLQRSGTRGKADNVDDAIQQLASQIQVGDIILTSNEPGRGCWYLNKVQNWAIDPRYCHAALVIERNGPTSVTTIEATNSDHGVQVAHGREQELVFNIFTKLAVLRVRDGNGQTLDSGTIQAVINKALQWTGAKYAEPPVSLHGDPHQTGLYCSMLPYRAYLDGAGIDLDAFSMQRTTVVPFVVTPDELYESPRTEVVFESAPQDPPADDDPLVEDAPGPPDMLNVP
jgi:uncharacterized protein YycO